MDVVSGACDHPRATIVLPVLNNEAYVGQLIRSLLEQWQPDLELLVIDDGSSDGSLQAAHEALAGSDISAVFLRNGASLGLGMLPEMLRHARGSIIVQADSDDLALPGRITTILATFEQHPTCRLVTSNAVLLSPGGLPIGLLDTGIPDRVFNDALWAASRVGDTQWLGATSAFHRSLLEAFPSLDPQLCPYGIDLILAFRACLIGTHHYLAMPLIGWRQHAKNTHRLAGANARSRRAAERHGAFELMALAQKVRDLDAIAWGSGEQDRMANLAAACHATFLTRFAAWSRIRNSSGSHDHDIGGSVPLKGEPPILQLRRGERYDFGTRGRLGAVVEAWDGVYQSEAEWCWTSRSAILRFGLARSGARDVTLCLSRIPWPHQKPVLVSLNLGQLAPFTVGESPEVVTLTIGDAAANDQLSILIHVPDATSPSALGMSEDGRILGVKLSWIKVS